METGITLDIRMLLKKWKTIVAFAAVFFLLAYCYASFFQHPTYKNTKVYVIVNNIYAADQAASINDITVSRSLAETYSGMISMSEMMQQLSEYLEKEYDMEISYRTLRSWISVTVVDQTESLRISVTTEDIEKTRIVSEAVESYLIPTVSHAYGSAEIKRFGDEINLVDTPNVAKMCLCGLAFGAFAAIALLVLLQITYNKVADEDNFRNKTSVPLLGTIPDPARLDKDGSFKNALAVHSSKNKNDARNLNAPLYLLSSNSLGFAYVENYNRLRTNLLFSLAARNDEKKTVVVSSAKPSECKTTLCANLAVSLAKLQYRVLVIDADMRQPHMHRLFGLRNTYGLSDVLLNASLERAITRGVAEETLDFLPAGTLPPNPSELLASQSFASLINELEKYYDFVLIDTPPILVVTDALMLSKISSGMLLACRYKKTSFTDLEKVTSSLDFANFNALGAVIVGSKDSYGMEKSRYNYGRNVK